MTKPAIENPVINSPFSEPTQHFFTTDSGEVTPETVPGRRQSDYLIPIPLPKKRVNQPTISGITPESYERQDMKLVNDIRDEIGRWRSDYPILLSLFKETRRPVGGMTQGGMRRRWFMTGSRSQIQRLTAVVRSELSLDRRFVSWVS